MLLKERIDAYAERCGGELPLPAGTAAGLHNERNADAVLASLSDVLRYSPVALVTAGSGTKPAVDGNAVKFMNQETGELAEVDYFDEDSRRMVNSIGLKNPGEEDYIPVVREASKIAEDLGKTLIMSVSSYGDEDPSVVTPVLAERFLEAGAHGVEIDLGCPNKVEASGQRHPVTGRDPEATHYVMEAAEARLGTSLWGPKLSHYYLEAIDGVKDYHDLRAILDVVNQFSADFITLTNTDLNVVLTKPDGTVAMSEIPGNSGGGSGPYYADTCYDQLVVAKSNLPKRFDIISATGVNSGAEVLRRERAGALLSAMVSRPWSALKQGKTYSETMREVYEEYLEARQKELLDS